MARKKRQTKLDAAIALGINSFHKSETQTKIVKLLLALE